MKTITLTLLTLFSSHLQAAGPWGKNIKCVAELLRAEVAITDSGEYARLQVPFVNNKAKGSISFPGARLTFNARLNLNGGHWSPDADRLVIRAILWVDDRPVAVSESHSDMASTQYTLRLAKKQYPKLQVMNRLESVEMGALFPAHDRNLRQLIDEGTVPRETPYIATLVCGLSRPGM